MKTLAVDVDDVLLDYIDNLIAYHNRNYGTKLLPKDVFSYSLGEVFCCGEVEALERIKAFEHSKAYRTLPARPDARVHVPELALEFRLVAITARATDLRDFTEQWLGDNFPSCFYDVIFTGRTRNMDFSAIKKAHLAQDIGAVAAIDDVLHNANDYAHAGIPAYLFGHRPYNEGRAHDKVTRVADWHDARPHFKKH